MLNFLFLLLLLRTSREDWRNKSFSFELFSSLFTLICLFHPNNTSMCLIYVVCLCINHLTHEHFIGNGDIDILWIGFTLITPQKWFLWIMIACVCQLLVQTLTTNKQAHLPFVPSLTCGWLFIFPFIS